MSKPSLNLEIQNLLKQVQESENTLSHNKTALKQLELKKQTLKAEIDRQTKRLLDEQASVLEAAQKKANKELESTKNLTVLTENNLAITREKVSTLSITITDLETELENIQSEIKTRKETAESLDERIKMLQDKTDALIDGQKRLELANSQLESRNRQLQEEQQTLVKEIEHTKTIAKTAQLKFDKDKKELDDLLALTEAALKEKQQEILAIRDEEALIRSDLAKMQRIQDERDTNLRMREAKVTQEESRIIRNSNLMKL